MSSIIYSLLAIVAAGLMMWSGVEHNWFVWAATGSIAVGCWYLGWRLIR